MCPLPDCGQLGSPENLAVPAVVPATTDTSPPQRQSRCRGGLAVILKDHVLSRPD